MPDGRDALAARFHESLFRECGRAHYRDPFEAMA